jgi:biopolymer transport protein ExbD
LAGHSEPAWAPQVGSTPVDIAVGVAPETTPALSGAADWSVESGIAPDIAPETPGDWILNSDAPPTLAQSEPAPPAQETPLNGVDAPAINSPLTLPEPPVAPVRDTFGAPIVGSPPALPESAPALQDAAPDAFAAPMIDSTATARESSVLDPFSPLSGAPLPEPIPNFDPLVDAAGSAPDVLTPSSPPKALVLVELTANADGSVKQLRYLTEELGNDDEAFQKLEQQIIAWAGELAGSDLTVQIVGDPQLRFEHVSRVMKICSPLVTRVVLAKAEVGPTVELVIGFVRDRQGQRINATPVLFKGEELVPISQLGEQFKSWGFMGQQQAEATVLIRVDSEVKADVVEEVIRHARNAGFEQFSLKTIDPQASTTPDMIGMVIGVNNETRMVNIALDIDGDLRPGQVLSVERPSEADAKPGPVIAQIEVTRMLTGTLNRSAACRVVFEDVFQPIRVGDIVLTTSGNLPEPAPKLEEILPLIN